MTEDGGREILFRGKRIDNNEWICGSLLTSDWNVDEYKRCAIVRSFAHDFQVSTHDVIPNSIGQYSGFQDENGKKIFKGDLIKQRLEDQVEEKGYCYWFAEIRFVRGCWVACQLGFNYETSSFEDFTKLYEDHQNFEVIGNIFEDHSKFNIQHS